MNNPVFVVGSPRSGTTYLSRALGLAKDTAYLGESTLFCLGAARIDRKRYAGWMKPADIFPYHAGVACNLAALDRMRGKDRIGGACEHLLRMAKVETYDLKPSNTLYLEQGISLDESERDDLVQLTMQWGEMLRTDGVATYARQYMTEFSRRKGCGTVVEKTPEHLRYLPVIHAVFPGSKVVLIKRDKQECLRSFLRTFGKGPGINRLLPPSLAKRKVWHELKADERREAWAETQPWVRAVEYSNFITHPERVLAELVEWLGLDFDFGKYGDMFAPNKVLK